MVSFYTVSVFSCFFFRGLNQYTTGSWRTKTLQIPLEREQYLDAKKHYNSSDPQSREELKKLLMRRAMVSIPLVISLQNEGNAIERLYKKGMLTDDMHFRVKELKAFVEQEFHDVQQEAEEVPPISSRRNFDLLSGYNLLNLVYNSMSFTINFTRSEVLTRPAA